ncbi:hypothetical protein F511_19620 [Dorcoceras hygrometricum]|uniref:Uncharacterized protein n=1 Tax=Dorcoceras hygrometricum TaxID=472368 RepID=A0A2Z7CVD8_9LAMI|nr:hypothetical protein F511_19620 [Dorcoceras hygrometricum]
MEEEQEDRFASIIKFCNPTASQEVKLRNCPLARESENFLDSNPDPISSSPEPMQSPPIGIVIVSLPDSSDKSADRNSSREEDAVFHTPPEEQNPDESSSDGARSIDLKARFRKKKRLRISGVEIGDELTSKKNKVCEELNGDTVPIDDTEMITTELDENEGIRKLPETVDLLSTDSGDDSLEKIAESVFRDAKEVERGKLEETEGVVEKFMHDCDTGNGNDVLMTTCEHVENVKANKYEMPHKNDTCYGTIGNNKSVGNGCVEMRDSGMGGDEEFGNITEVENVNKETREVAGWRIARKSIEDIDKFKYVGDRENGGLRNTRVRAVGGVGRKRELPMSLKGKEKNMGDGDVAANSVGTKTRMLKDFLHAFNLVVGEAEEGCGDTDFLEIAKSRGMTFPRPRWWPSEGDESYNYWP